MSIIASYSGSMSLAGNSPKYCRAGTEKYFLSALNSAGLILLLPGARNIETVSCARTDTLCEPALFNCDLLSIHKSPFLLFPMRPAAKSHAGLTQSEAATLVYSTLRTWQNWESPICSPAHRKMHPAIWELFLIKTGQNHVAKS